MKVEQSIMTRPATLLFMAIMAMFAPVTHGAPVSDALIGLITSYRDRETTDVEFATIVERFAKFFKDMSDSDKAIYSLELFKFCKLEADSMTAYAIARSVMAASDPKRDFLAAMVRAEYASFIRSERRKFDYPTPSDEDHEWQKLRKSSLEINAMAQKIGANAEVGVESVIDATKLAVLLQAMFDAHLNVVDRVQAYCFILDGAHQLPKQSHLVQLLTSDDLSGVLTSQTTGDLGNQLSRSVVDLSRNNLLHWLDQHATNVETARQIANLNDRAKAMSRVIAEIKDQLRNHNQLIKNLQQDSEQVKLIQAQHAQQIEGLREAMGRVATHTRVEGSLLKKVEDSGKDDDGDGIDDGYEQQLLKTFAPIFRVHDSLLVEPMPRVGVPMNASVFLDRHATLPDLHIEDLQRNADNWRWHPGWSKATKGDDGFYGRVCPHDGPVSDNRRVYWVQYYLFLSFNGRGANNNVKKGFGIVEGQIDPDTGSHDADLLLVDLGVDVTARSFPFVHHAILHNHGRQHFVYPRALTFVAEGEARRPVIFMEDRCWELWPNAGSRDEGWPTGGGFATTERFIVHMGDVKVMDENELCGEHWGSGIEYNPARNTNRVRNLGELSEDGTVQKVVWWAHDQEPNEADLADVSRVMTHKAGYGSFTYAGNVKLNIAGIRAANIALKEFFSVEVPKGPPFQDKMWRRKFGLPATPFCQGSDPYRLDAGAGATVVTHTVEGGAAFNPSLFKP